MRPHAYVERIEMMIPRAEVEDPVHEQRRGLDGTGAEVPEDLAAAKEISAPAAKENRGDEATITGEAAPQFRKCFRNWRLPVAASTTKKRPRSWLTKRSPYPTTGGNSMMFPRRKVQIFLKGGRSLNCAASCVRAAS
jgi:hypothetical protein